MSVLAFHGPGDRLDSHLANPDPHPTLVSASSIEGPEILVPPAAMIAASATATWYGVNACTLMRFTVPVTKAYRYVNLYVGIRSGNFQVGVCSVRREGSTLYATRIMNSGVLAMSSLSGDNSDQKVDCGETTLEAGEYGLFLWCDNTTATFQHSLSTGFRANRLTFSQTVSGGLPVAPTETGFAGTTRWVTSLTLESDYS